MKTAFKKILYESGLSGRYHRTRNRNSLTTLMLHRVLPEQQQKVHGSIPEWTLTDATFSAFLQFINKHYTVVPLETVEKRFKCKTTTSKPAMLLTFDDGWLDNYQFAYPELLKTHTPATIFVATDKIGSQHGFWQEKIFAATRLSPEILSTIKQLAPNPDAVHDANTLIQQLKTLEPVESNYIELMNIVNGKQCDKRQMLNSEEIVEMSKNRISFGVHGASHRPLATLTPDELDQDIRRSVSVLKSITGVAPNSISFPHGSYTKTVQKTCSRHGLDHQFSSTRAIHLLNKQLPPSDGVFTPFPRSHIAERSITQNMCFSTAKAAFTLFRLPLR